VSSHSLDVLATLSPRVPDSVSARAAGWSAQDVPAVPAAAASVVLLRDGRDGLETYLLLRHARMPFAASMVVFPGGRVDREDTSPGADPIRACALRETEEETGVVLDDADLQEWAHWITPEFEPRRYDTHFFVAAMPAGQEARDISGETDSASWCALRAALVQHHRGEIALMPPTLSILVELAEVASTSAVRELSRGRVVESVLPRLVRSGGSWVFEYPTRLDRP
jgi:8-oxo-dGTP pyrophosphatase MutT (NUDIX family)